MSDPCEYCGQDPCDCPVFDMPDEHEDPDEVGDENDEGPIGFEP